MTDTEQQGWAGKVTTGATPRRLDYTEAFTRDIEHVLTAGQSLSQGWSSTPAISTTPVPGGLRLANGVRGFDGNEELYFGPDPLPISAFGPFAPLVESEHPSAPWGETPCAGTVQALDERMRAENGCSLTDIGRSVLISAPGFGGQNINALNEGTLFFRRLIEQVRRSAAAAAAAGRSYGLSAVTWTQAESDYFLNTPTETYMALLRQMRLSIEGQAAAITGLNRTLPLIMYQCASHGAYGQPPRLAMAMAGLCEEHPFFILATPAYHLTYADEVHLTAESSKWLGGYYGRALKRLLVDGRKPMPLAPTRVSAIGLIISARFRLPEGAMRLVLDTVEVTDPGACGFEVLDVAGAPVRVLSLSLVGSDTVEITTAQPAAGGRLRYAYTAPAGYAGRTSGARGCLRDDCPDVFDPVGINKPLHNWCVIFDREIASQALPIRTASPKHDGELR